MGILLSLITAISFGAADFCGGMASRRVQVPAVILGSHVIGLVGVTAVAFVVADAFSWVAFGYGAAGGLVGLVGLVFLYRRLAVGPMSVVAPITAITSALVPAVWAWVRGEGLTMVTLIGVLVALIAIGLISASDTESSGRDNPAITARVIVESLLAGAGFGGFFVLLDQAAIATAPWPITGARTASVAALVIWLLVARPGLGSSTSIPWRWIALAGFFDTFSNAVFLWSAELAGLGVASVLSSLYPASTVVLAFAVLGERLSRVQLAGFALAVAGTALIAAG